MIQEKREWTLAWYHLDVGQREQGSCALIRRPAESRDTLMDPVPTRCKHFVSVPIRYSVGEPTCTDCRNILNLPEKTTK